VFDGSFRVPLEAASITESQVVGELARLAAAQADRDMAIGGSDIAKLKCVPSFGRTAPTAGHSARRIPVRLPRYRAKPDGQSRPIAEKSSHLISWHFPAGRR
jgi:hypothetical protein